MATLFISQMLMIRWYYGCHDTDIAAITPDDSHTYRRRCWLRLILPARYADWCHIFAFDAMPLYWPLSPDAAGWCRRWQRRLPLIIADADCHDYAFTHIDNITLSPDYDAATAIIGLSLPLFFIISAWAIDTPLSLLIISNIADNTGQPLLAVAGYYWLLAAAFGYAIAITLRLRWYALIFSYAY